MYSVGIDLVEVSRIKNSVQKTGTAFLSRFFADSEIEIFKLPNDKLNYQRIAGNFAAKEAFSKAIKTGIRNFSLKDIAILRDKLGAPYITLEGSLSELLQMYSFDVSITHTSEYAQAIVIAEKV